MVLEHFPLNALLVMPVHFSHWQGNTIVSRVLLGNMQVTLQVHNNIRGHQLALIARQVHTAMKQDKLIPARVNAAQDFLALRALHIVHLVHQARLIQTVVEQVRLVFNALQTLTPMEVQSLAHLVL